MVTEAEKNPANTQEEGMENTTATLSTLAQLDAGHALAQNLGKVRDAFWAIWPNTHNYEQAFDNARTAWNDLGLTPAEFDDWAPTNLPSKARLFRKLEEADQLRDAARMTKLMALIFAGILGLFITATLVVSLWFLIGVGIITVITAFLIKGYYFLGGDEVAQ